MTKNELLFAVLPLFGIGGMMLLGGLYSYYYFRTIKKKKCSAVTEGKIVEMKLDSQRRLHPIVEYQVDGKTYKARKWANITTRVATRNKVEYRNGYELGEIVTVHYDPYKPTQWYMKNSKEQNVVSIIFICFGIVFLAVGILIYVLNS